VVPKIEHEMTRVAPPVLAAIVTRVANPATLNSQPTPWVTLFATSSPNEYL
jgi:hypothetical protein